MRIAGVLFLVVFGLAAAGSAVAEVCGVDELPNDVRNCGTCGNDCMALGANTLWECRTGTCTPTGCANGFYDLDNNGICEYACAFRSTQEACNNLDDDCDGQVDEGVSPPSPVQVCGVSPAANSAACTSSVGVSCVNGAWSCSFPAGVCTGPTCAQTAEVCDAVDNNCDGRINENVPNFGQACASDDGLPAPGHGLCRTVGTFVCNGPANTMCNAVQASCASLPGGCTELCDGLDNDCDGSIDEVFNNKGSNAAFFMRPAVTRIAASRWIFQYEASRPNATAMTQGTGSGLQFSSDGRTIDRMRACSEPGRLPWTRASRQEIEQACQAMGGNMCLDTDLVTACTLGSSACTFPYSPRGVACQSPATVGSKFCNLGGTWDADPLSAGDQDALLVTNDPSVMNCSADWSDLQGNTQPQSQIFDLGGNVREWVRSLSTGNFRLFGGSLWNRVEASAGCQMPMPPVPDGLQLDDAGFRCCFYSDPTL